VTNDEEEYDEDEDDYEENACVSASQLLQQAGRMFCFSVNPLIFAVVFGKKFVTH